MACAPAATTADAVAIADVGTADVPPPADGSATHSPATLAPFRHATDSLRAAGGDGVDVGRSYGQRCQFVSRVQQQAPIVPQRFRIVLVVMLVLVLVLVHMVGVALVAWRDGW